MVLASARAAAGVPIRAGMNVIPIAKALTSMTPPIVRQNPSHDATSTEHAKEAAIEKFQRAGADRDRLMSDLQVAQKSSHRELTAGCTSNRSKALHTISMKCASQGREPESI